jgi:formate-dependent nitrite reductase membrane component NrfD
MNYFLTGVGIGVGFWLIVVGLGLVVGLIAGVYYLVDQKWGKK